MQKISSSWAEILIARIRSPTSCQRKWSTARRALRAAACGCRLPERSPSQPRDDVCMTDELLPDQIAYYRQRAVEYDVTAYEDVAAARGRIARGWSRGMQPTGRVSEFACGNGLWTEALARFADPVTAIDAAVEAVAIARDRVRSDNVMFEVADVFSRASEERFDVIFFSAWLPMCRPAGSNSSGRCCGGSFTRRATGCA
jgi:methyltransferase family protein